MNVDPVQANVAGIERQTPENKVPVAPSPLGAASGNAPKTEITGAQYTPAPPVIPEHEVKLQLDTSSDMVVYQLLDKQSGALVLQVPSAQQIRNIQQTQELLQRIAARGKVSR
jgi:hypothetical protein